MQDLDYLESLGATAAKLKAKFTAATPADGIRKLLDRHAAILQGAVNTNIEEAPIWGAIDQALQSAQSNVPFIQARWLAMQGKTSEEVIKAFQTFKLQDMLSPAFDPLTGEPRVNPQTRLPLLEINLPLFAQVHVPLTYAYCQMRAARLFNDRNVYPRYKYSPPRITHKETIKTEIVTSRIQRMTSDMGYAADDKQAFHQMCYYGTAFQFPREYYWRDSFKTRVNGKAETRTRREGVRFVMPHPRRHFWDRSEPLHTFNTDTGVSYAGFWDIQKFGDVQRGDYWNTDKVVAGGYDAFASAAWDIYQRFYPCVVTPPKSWEPGVVMDRVDKEQNYLKDEYDASVVVATLFHRLIPKDYGLFDYDEPVWFRFLYANYGTVLWAEPLAYTPGCVFLHGYNAHQTIGTSLALQLTPFEQLVSNFLTQHTVSVQHNLERVRFVNTDIVPSDHLKFLQRMGDRLITRSVYLGYSRKNDRDAMGAHGGDRRLDAVIPMPSQMVMTAEIANNLRLTLDVLERMLGFSAQEVGAAAAHEQSATETTIVSNYAANNLTYMGTGIDDALIAKKRLLYDAMFCYGDDEIWATVTDLTPERRAALDELGFEIQDGAQDGADRFTVKGRKGALTLDSFVDTSRSGPNRLDDSKLGIAMLQSLGQVLQNPVLFGALGLPQTMELISYVWQMIGLPDDYRPVIRNDPKVEQAKQQEQVLQLLGQMKQGIVADAVTIATESVGKQLVPQLSQHLAVAFNGLADQMKQLAQKNQQQDEALTQLAALLSTLTAQPADVQIQPPVQIPVPAGVGSSPGLV